MKNGAAMGEPQSAASSVHRPLELVSSIIASLITPDQSSPVRHWNRMRHEDPKLSKLRSSEMPLPIGPCAMKVKVLTPTAA